MAGHVLCLAIRPRQLAELKFAGDGAVISSRATDLRSPASTQRNRQLQPVQRIAKPAPERRRRPHPHRLIDETPPNRPVFFDRPPQGCQRSIADPLLHGNPCMSDPRTSKLPEVHAPGLLGATLLQPLPPLSPVDMDGAKKPSSLQKLIKRVASLGQHARHSSENIDPASRSTTDLASTTPSSSRPSSMAEQEEDYSSLPLVDRWVHKVCFPCFRLAGMACI